MALTVTRLKVVVDADTKKAEAKLAAFHHRLEKDFDSAGERAGKASVRGVGRGMADSRKDVFQRAGQLGKDAGQHFANAFGKQATRQQTAKVAVNAQTAGLRGQVTRAVKAAGAGQRVRVPVDVDQRGLSRLSPLLKQATRDAGNLRSQLTSLGFGVFAAGASLAASAVGALGSAVIGLAANIAPMAGLLGGLPGLLGAAVQGFGVLKLAFSGMGTALKAMSQAQIKSGQTATKSGVTQRAAAEQIRNARLSVVRAEHDAADAAVEGARRVQDAQRGLSDSQRSARQAQENLTQARRDARLALIDLRLEVQRNALSQERAALNVEIAFERLKAARADPTTDPLGLRDSDLDYREAVQSLKEITEERRRSATDLARANRVGISGSDQVRAAAERVADAQRGITDAIRGVRDAQQQAARAGADATARVAEAQHDLAAAAANAADKTSALPSALQQVQDKLAVLSPAGRRFADVLFSFKPIIDQFRRTAQKNMFPGLTSGLLQLRKLTPTVNTIVGQTARVFGRLGAAAGKMFSSGPWRKDLATIGRRNAVVLGRAGQMGLNLADALRNIMIAAEPLVTWVSKLTLGWSEQAKAAAQAGRENGRLRQFFIDSRDTTKQWFSILGNLSRVLFNIGRAAKPLGDSLAGSLERGSKALARLTGSASGQQKLTKYFNDMRPALDEIGRLARDVAKAFISISSDPDLPKVVAQIRTELLPVLVEFFHQMRQAAPVFLNIISTAVGGLLKLINTVPGLGRLVGIIAGLNVAFRAIRLVNTALGINSIARALLGLGTGGAVVRSFTQALVGLVVKLPLVNAAIQAIGDSAVATGTKVRLAGLAFAAYGAAAAAGAYQGSETFKLLDSNRKQTGLFAKQRDWLNRVTTIAITKEQKARQAAQDNAKQQDVTSTAATRAAVRLAAMRAQTYSVTQAQGDFTQALSTVETSLVGYREQAAQAGGSLARSLGAQKMDFQTWSTDVQKLMKRGMSPKEILTLRDMGPQYIHQFAAATDIEFAKLKIIWQRRVKAARIAAQIEALLAGQGSAQSIATGLNSKDKIVRDAAKNILSHLPKSAQVKVEVVYDQARNIKILQKFAKALHTTIGGQPVLVDPHTGNFRNLKTGKDTVSAATRARAASHNAAGNVHERHSAQIARAGAMRVWAEPETGGEAYIPLARSKRPRSTRILSDVASRFGMRLESYAQGDIRQGPARRGRGAPQAGTGPGAKYLLQKLLAVVSTGTGGDVGRGGKPGADGLAPNVHQARELIRQLFGIQNIGGFARSGHVANSDHYTGHALDVMTGNRRTHEAVIRWFMGRSDKKYWISFGRIASAMRGWTPRPYHGTSPHRDHVHLSFFGAGGLLGKVGRMPGFAAGGVKRGDGPAYLHGGEGVLNRRAMGQVGPAGLNALNRGDVGGVYIAPGAVQIVVQGDVAGGAVLQRLEATVDRKLTDLAAAISAGRRS